MQVARAPQSILYLLLAGCSCSGVLIPNVEVGVRDGSTKQYVCDATLEVRDSAGKLVATKSLDAGVASGCMFRFVLLPPGRYRLTATRQTLSASKDIDAPNTCGMSAHVDIDI